MLYLKFKFSWCPVFLFATLQPNSLELAQILYYAPPGALLLRVLCLRVLLVRSQQLQQLVNPDSDAGCVPGCL